MIKASLRRYGAVLGLLLFGILISVLYPRLSARWAPEPPGSMALPTEPDCKPLGATCLAEGEDLSIGLRLPGEVRPLRRFPVEVQLAGRQAAAVQTVAVHFTMPGMAMGVNRFILTRQPDDSWRGQAMLPICSTGRRDWLATVQAVADSSYTGTFSVIAGP